MTGTAPTYRTALPADAPSIARLVNAAYRGASGWTRETQILSGERTRADSILETMRAPESLFLLCHRGDELVGCAFLKRVNRSEGYLGMLAVAPEGQQEGLGKALMGRAEDLARELWDATALSITVINRRPELIAYYLRRGYAPTGETQPFPVGDGPSVALVDGLELVVLKKALK